MRLRKFKYFALKCRDMNQLHRNNSRRLKPSRNNHVNAHGNKTTENADATHSRLHTDAQSQLAVPDPQTDFLRANAGHLGRRQKERQQE